MDNPTKLHIIAPHEPILITGASGFIGLRIVDNLLTSGFRNLRCFVRPSSRISQIEDLRQQYRSRAQIELIQGNLLSPEDCHVAVKGVKVIYHLAAATGGKSFPEAVMNSVVTTRNLLEACLQQCDFRRFVNVSSFTVYTNQGKTTGRVLDESCPVEEHPEWRGDAYAYGKVKQDQLVMRYGQEKGIPYVIVRPGYVYGPGKQAISGRVGIDTFGVFLHLGGRNKLPFTYVDNCAEAIALSGVRAGIDQQIFNIVDDEVPSSRQFLRLYKANVKDFNSYYLPHIFSYVFCWLWELYAQHSDGQLPLAFNRRRWYVDWKSTVYSNAKLKELVGWRPKVPLAEGLSRYFEGCRSGRTNA